MINDDDEANAQTSKTSKPISNTLIKPTQAKSSLSHRRSSLFFLSILIASVALISSVYAIYISKKIHQLAKQQTIMLSDGLDNLKQQQTNVQTNLVTTTQTLNQAQEKIQGKLQELDQQLQATIEQRFYQKQDWILLKARYYLELAQINNHWSEDNQVTLTLLQKADELLATLANSQLFAIRQAIAKEITALKAQPRIDMVGLLSRLDAAQNLIENLPIKTTFTPTTYSNANKDTDSSYLSNWKTRFEQSMQFLEKLFVIRHRDEENSPISPLQEAVLHESIRLHLQEAQWAILKNNPQLFVLSLGQAIKDVEHNFDLHQKNTLALLTLLQKLQQEKIISMKPSIDQSLPLLNQFIEKMASSENSKPS